MGIAAVVQGVQAAFAAKALVGRPGASVHVCDLRQVRKYNQRQPAASPYKHTTIVLPHHSFDSNDPHHIQPPAEIQQTKISQQNSMQEDRRQPPTQQKGFTSFRPPNTPPHKQKKIPLNSSIASPTEQIFHAHLIKPIESCEKHDRASQSPADPGPRNPFARFYNDSNSKAVFSEKQSKPKEPPAEGKGEQAAKQESSDSVVETNEWLRENYLKKNRLIIRNPVRGSHLCFFRRQKPIIFSKLLWFKPNSKNGRNLFYDTQQHRCVPFFKCAGCSREFDVASALGGHLSSCDKKGEHFFSLLNPSQMQAAFSQQQQKLRSTRRLLFTCKKGNLQDKQRNNLNAKTFRKNAQIRQFFRAAKKWKANRRLQEAQETLNWSQSEAESQQQLQRRTYPKGQ